MVEKSLQYLGAHTQELKITGTVQFDRNKKPKKEKFFKSRELLPSSVISSVVQNCDNIRLLHLDRCVLGPHMNTKWFPQTLETLIVRSTIFVKKASFFSNIWTHLKQLKELRVENIQNFNKDDCYAVIESLNIDFDVKFDDLCLSFIFYRKP